MMLQSLSVVHAPMEIAGQVGTICRFLRKAGIQAVGYNYFPSYLNYEGTIVTDSYELIKLAQNMIEHFDLFHFHNGYTLFDDFRDIEMIREAGKRIIMHHRGNDVRFRSRARKMPHYENPYVYAENSLPDEKIDRNLRYFAEHVSAAIVQDHELLPYVEDYYAAKGKKVYVLPRLFDIGRCSPKYPARGNREVLIVHAPTDRDFKGTEYVNRTIERLKEELPVRYRLIEKMSHQEAWKILEQADIVIDQILCGAYGNLSVEGMALGKPVVCYIRPDLVDKYPPGLPIQSANPDTLYDVLKELVRQPELRVELGRRGRRYVENHHHAEKVVRSLIAIYQEVMGGE